MNECAASRLPALLGLLPPLLLAAGGGGSAEPPLKGAAMGGPFTLTDHRGHRVSERDFAGFYKLVYFGFTYCPDVCPVDLQTIAAGLSAFERDDPERAARVVPIFISVDPARDTPPVLAQYVSAFHPRLVGLTGSEQEIAEVARRFAVYYRPGEPAPDGAYLVDHLRAAVLYGPEGEPIAIVPHDQGPAGVAAQLDRWVR